MGQVEHRRLPQHIQIDCVMWDKVDERVDKWYIYKRHNIILNDEGDYIAFKAKKYTDCGKSREVRPVPEYEENKQWYYESEDLEECYKWIDTIKK